MTPEIVKRRLRASNWLYGAIVGFALGLLVAALVVPDRAPTTLETGQASGGAPGEATDLPSGPGAGSAGSAATGTAVGGADAAGATAPPSGTAGGDGGSAAVAPSRNVRGVTADTIRIGVAVHDLGALSALGENYDVGNVPQQWEALLDKWRREGRVPVNGREVELVFSRPYNILSDAEKRAACVELVQEKQVFAVVATVQFGIGHECVAREYRTPMLGAEGVSEEMMARSWPNLFTLQMTSSKVLRNWAHWGHRRGALRGKTIGLYYPGDAATVRDVEENLKKTLARLGYAIKEEVRASSLYGGPEDGIAVQRFKAAGVNLAMILTAPAARGNFQQQAEANDFRPTYIDNDLNFATGDTATQSYPPQHYDGTYAMTAIRAGERKHPPQTLECVENYERYAKTRINRPGEGGTAKWTGVTYICDVGNTLLAGLRAAGRDLRPATLVRGLETVRGMEMARHADVTFGADKHTGADRQRTIRWHAEVAEEACRCWLVAGDWGSLYAA